jgi:hypothetical protein
LQQIPSINMMADHVLCHDDARRAFLGGVSFHHPSNAGKWAEKRKNNPEDDPSELA